MHGKPRQDSPSNARIAGVGVVVVVLFVEAAAPAAHPAIARQRRKHGRRQGTRYDVESSCLPKIPGTHHSYTLSTRSVPSLPSARQRTPSPDFPPSMDA